MICHRNGNDLKERIDGNISDNTLCDGNTYNIWDTSKNQPNSCVSNNGEDCVSMQFKNNFEWHDYDCNKKFHCFFCNRDKTIYESRKLLLLLYIVMN